MKKQLGIVILMLCSRGIHAQYQGPGYIRRTIKDNIKKVGKQVNADKKSSEKKK